MIQSLRGVNVMCLHFDFAVRVSEARFYRSGVAKPVQHKAVADVRSLASLCCMLLVHCNCLW